MNTFDVVVEYGSNAPKILEIAPHKWSKKDPDSAGRLLKAVLWDMLELHGSRISRIEIRRRDE